MNYKFIKWIIDTLIENYRCPSCGYTIIDDNVDIIWAAWNSINIDIACGKCKKHSLIKSELNDISKPMNYWPKITQNWIEDTSKNTYFEKNFIENEQIVNLNKKLKKQNINASDLFNEQ